MRKPLELRWLGVAGLELRTPLATLLVDPFLTRPPVHRLFYGRTPPDGALLRQHIPQADFILVSHAHYDHLLDAAEVAGYTGAQVYGSAHTGRILEACGLGAGQVVRVRAGEVLPLPPHPCARQGAGGTPVPSPLSPGTEWRFSVNVLRGEHAPIPFARPGRLPARLRYPLRLRDFVLDEDFGFLIEAEGTRLLAWHDWRPGPAPQADVLVTGADIHLGELGELLDQVQPRLLIPTHWDNFLRPLSKPLKPFYRPPCPGHPLPERYDPGAVKRWVSRNHPRVKVWVPVLMERVSL